MFFIQEIWPEIWKHSVDFNQYSGTGWRKKIVCLLRLMPCKSNFKGMLIIVFKLSEIKFRPSHPRACRATSTPTFLKLVSILTRCVSKISWPNVFGKFGVFYHKKQIAEFYQYPVPQKSNFYWQWRFLKKLYRICTDD